VSPHDALGSNLVVQVKNDRVMRVLPLENEAINECWLSDKDRFSYEALGSEERLTEPRIKENGEWRVVDWPTALETVAKGLKETAARHGGDAVGVLASPHATFEELALAARLVRGLGGGHVDHRLRQVDFSDDAARAGIPWLGMSVADVGTLDRALVVGSFLRKDHPLVAARLRLATKKHAQVSSLHAVDDDWLMPVAHKAIVPAVADARDARGHRRRRPRRPRARKCRRVLRASRPRRRPTRSPRACSAAASARCSWATRPSSIRTRRSCARSRRRSPRSSARRWARWSSRPTRSARRWPAPSRATAGSTRRDARRAAQGLPSSCTPSPSSTARSRSRRARRSRRPTSSS
jgi:hypothetical protein